MIDTHIHLEPPRLPGVGILSTVLNQSPEALAATLQQQMSEAGATHALAMGSLSDSPDDPLGVGATLQLAQSVPGLHAVGVADPTRTEAEHLKSVAAVLASGRVKALKAYLGYLHYGPDYSGYLPYYELAAQHHLPFIFHTGDTYSPRAKLRFAHPLLVDDVAVDHPKVNFVLAHLGNPWLAEAAEVVYKNVNVWADLSGLIVGEASVFEAEERQELLKESAIALARAFRYAERPNRFLYGSDWPLAPMIHYRDFIRSAIPEMFHGQIFTDNAKALFRL